ncbi:MAG TPA: transglycosylase SLT domain-containing protein [Plasticicumulans sp.]|nr:transglycosylase SLT domain-containing protein [Plasticicumulans sp.]
MTGGSAVLLAALGSAQAAGVSAGVPAMATLLAAPVAQQVEWGQRFEHGEGVGRNAGRALTLYCAAAGRGSVDAQYRLGWMYAMGRGVARDDALAAAWFRQAAAKGDPQAQQMLKAIGKVAVKTASCRAPAAQLQSVAYRPSTPRPLDLDTPERRQIVAWVNELAPQYQLDPALVLAVITAESNFRADAQSTASAMGLMQLIQATADRFGVQNVWDPQQNLRGGMAYLRWLLAYFRGDVQLALAGYNAGENAVDRNGGIPPYAETQNYVARILQQYGRMWHPHVEGLTEPSALVAALPPGQGPVRTTPVAAGR